MYFTLYEQHWFKRKLERFYFLANTHHYQPITKITNKIEASLKSRDGPKRRNKASAHTRVNLFFFIFIFILTVTRCRHSSLYIEFMVGFSIECSHIMCCITICFVLDGDRLVFLPLLITIWACTMYRSVKKQCFNMGEKRTVKRITHKSAKPHVFFLFFISILFASMNKDTRSLTVRNEWKLNCMTMTIHKKNKNEYIRIPHKKISGLATKKEEKKHVKMYTQISEILRQWFLNQWKNKNPSSVWQINNAKHYTYCIGRTKLMKYINPFWLLKKNFERHKFVTWDE